MSDEKMEGDNIRAIKRKRFIRIVFIALVVVLLCLSISSFLFTVRSGNTGSKLATAPGTSTPTPSPTPIYLETPPVQSEFYDTFKNNAQDWSVSSTEGYYRSIESGELTLENTNVNTTMVESLPTNSTFDNGTIIVDLTILEANTNDSVGLYVRGDTNLEHDYRIDLNGNGTFDIAKEYLDSRNNPQSIILFGPKSDTALDSQGARNTIVLTMNGSRLQLLINNERVGVAIDRDYVDGQVALFARLGKSSKKVAVGFTKVEIDKLTGTLAGAGGGKISPLAINYNSTLIRASVGKTITPQ
ncbi:MAG: hypothetical protein ACXVDN_06425 [Ktedonobacteraceae bacterium]